MTAANSNTRKIRWQDLRLWAANGDGEITGEDRVPYLQEFRDRGTILGAFLVDPDECSTDEEAVEGGPDPEDIDWTEFPS